jgi:hypothetical protein
MPASAGTSLDLLVHPMFFRNVGILLNYTALRPTSSWGVFWNTATRFYETRVPPSGPRGVLTPRGQNLNVHRFGILRVGAACQCDQPVRSGGVVEALCYKPEGRGFETRWGE